MCVCVGGGGGGGEGSRGEGRGGEGRSLGRQNVRASKEMNITHRL